jgi:hypothetical protein
VAPLGIAEGEVGEVSGGDAGGPSRRHRGTGASHSGPAYNRTIRGDPAGTGGGVSGVVRECV